MAMESSGSTVERREMIAFFEREIQTILDANEDGNVILEKITERGERRSEDHDGALAEVLGGWLERTSHQYKVSPDNPDAPYWLYAIKTVSHVAMKVATSGGNAEQILQHIARPMLEIVCLDLPTDLLFNVMESLINIARVSPRALRESFYTNLRLHLRSVATLLARCGDYPTQQSLLRILMHLTPQAGAERRRAAQYLFSQDSFNDEAINTFVYLNSTNFSKHSRYFLMMLNYATEMVVHLLCESVVLDDVALIGLSGEKTEPLFVEFNTGTRSLTIEWNPRAVERESGRPLLRCLSRLERCQLTVAEDSLQQVQMHRLDCKAVIDVRTKDIAIFRSPHDVISLLRLYPTRNLLSAHGALRHMYQDKYVCNISIDEAEDYNVQPRPSHNNQDSNISLEEEERPTAVSKPNSVASMAHCLKKCSVSLWRRGGIPKASSESSASTSSLQMLRQTLENQETPRDFYYRKINKCPFKPTYSNVPEIPTKVSVQTSGIVNDGNIPTCEVDSALDQGSDIPLVNDLYQAAIMELKEKQKKDAPVNNKENTSDNALSSPRNTKDETEVLSISEKIEKESSRNKENTPRKNLVSVNSRKHVTHGRTILKTKKKRKYTESDIATAVLSENGKSSKVDKGQDVIISESTIGDSTSDAIPDTPNVDMVKLPGRNSVKNPLNKTEEESKSSSIKETDVKLSPPKRLSRRVKRCTPEKCKTKPKKESLPTNSKPSKATGSSESEELNVSSMKPRKRMLYSPKSDFIIQEFDSEMDRVRHYSDDDRNAKETKVTKKKNKRVSSPYVLLQPLQYKPKSNLEEIFNNLKESNKDDQAVTLVNVTKDISVYNLTDSSEDEFQTQKKSKRSSSYSSNVTKRTTVTKRNRKAPNKSKAAVEKGIASNIKKTSKTEHILVDEKMRRREPADALLNISLQRESMQQKESDREDIMPVPEGLDNIEIEDIPQNCDQKSSDADYLSLNKSKSKPVISVSKEINTIDIQETAQNNSKRSTNISLNKFAVSLPKDLGTTEEIQEIAQKNVKKTTNVETRSLRKPKKKPAAVQKKQKRKIKGKNKTVKEQLDQEECSSSPPSLIIDMEDQHIDSFNFMETIKAACSPFESKTHTTERQTITDDLMLPSRQPSSLACKAITDTNLANIDCDARQSSGKSNVTRHSHIVIDSSPESVEEMEKSIPTVRGTTINAHGDGEEEPPNLTLLDDMVQGRDLQTERLNSADREFIESLIANNESLRSQSSSINLDRIMPQKSISDKEKSVHNVMGSSYSTPNKSDSTSFKHKTSSLRNMQWISPIRLPHYECQENLTNSSLQSSFTVQREDSQLRIDSQQSTGFTEGLFELNLPAQSSLNSSLQPKTAKKATSVVSPKLDRQDVQELRYSFTSQVSQEESTVKNVCEVLLQTIETGIRENSFTLKNGLVNALAEMFVSFDENKRRAQQEHNECMAEQRRLDEKKERAFREQQELHNRTVEELKSKVYAVIQAHSQQTAVRVQLLREDVRMMLRRYSKTEGHSLRLLSPNDD